LGALQLKQVGLEVQKAGSCASRCCYMETRRRCRSRWVRGGSSLASSVAILPGLLATGNKKYLPTA
jgi:hypothetical protein